MSEFGLNQIGQISTNARNLDRAVAFYRDTLGMKLLFQAPPKMAFFDCGGIRLLVGTPEKPEFDHPGSILYFKVTGIENAHRTLVTRGVKFEGDPHRVARMPDHELWIAFFRDSEGNLLALMEEKR